MPIKVKRDIKRKYGFGTAFSLRDIPNFETGSVLNRVRQEMADQNWNDFYKSWNISPDKSIVERNVSKSIAFKFNLLPSEEKTFDDLWTIASNGRKYAKDKKEEILTSVENGYKHIARIADGQSVDKPTFSRMPADRTDNVVVFSDFHMTAFDNKPNFFKDFNYLLYLDILKYYAKTDFCLVENGDVEECVIYEPTEADAGNRRKQARDRSGFPITQADDKWKDFMDTRYAQRKRTMDRIFSAFEGYYTAVKGFISRRKYVRLTGNHDTYLDEIRERDLKAKIETRLGTPVYDVLRVKRNEQIRYVITHGHQFDPACLQHGPIPYAKSLGEAYSECLAWAYQGPDRAWTKQDTQKWYIGNSYLNELAREEPNTYLGGGDGAYDLVTGSLNQIKKDSKDFVETLLGHQVAWEYFENTDGFNALTLEVVTGEEMYKLKHMNEIHLCERYPAEFLGLHTPPDFSKPIPTLVLGHTHEPRQHAVFPGSTRNATCYLNSGSAGRYENLVWCVEILSNEDRICSWSSVDGKLKKINWRSSGNHLVYDEHDVEWITV